MQTMYSNYAVEQGLAREARLGVILNKMKGHYIESRAKAPILAKRILSFFSLKPLKPGGKSVGGSSNQHADYVVEVESGIRSSITIHLQARGSERSSRSFERRCKLNRWGPIQPVVIADDDTDYSIALKIKQAIINGYNMVRRIFNQKIWRHQQQMLGELKLQHRHPLRQALEERYEAEGWCPQFNMARLCAH